MSRIAVAGLGEALWDVFPDGPRFGGAPANFACSVAQLAGDVAEACMVSAVGQDELGRRALVSLRRHGVDVSCVSQVGRPTGTVAVSVDSSGHASYEIVADVAWDALEWSDDLQRLATRAGAVCFGTLAQRSDRSREVIQRFVRATPPSCLRILDVNLRPPFWNEKIVRESFDLASVVKLNGDELTTIADAFGFIGDRRRLVMRLLEEFSLDLVALTDGAAGATLATSSASWSESPGEPTHVSDTVGAGDSFTAALAIGLIRGLPLDRINAWANRVASFVCSQPGAAPQFPDTLRLP
jgi:fructokinase